MITSRSARGFSSLVVLVLVASAMAIVVAVANIAVEQKYATASLSREPMARAIAETCADRAAAMASTMAPTGDFDRVLDPDGPRQFVPATGPIVQVPKTATDAFHTYALLKATDGFSQWCDGEHCGACLFRYDDNSDDGTVRKTGTDTFDSGLEGTKDNDIFHRDRDRTILVTAIGIYPASDGDDVYDSSRTRVTIRRLVATAPGTATPAVWVGERFTSDNGKICGTGGITADSMDFRNAPCICGDIKGARSRTPGSCSASDCSPVSCDAQRAGSTEAAQQDPVVTPKETTQPPVWLDGNWFDDPTETRVGNLGTNDTWELYVRVNSAPHKNASIGGTYAVPGGGLVAHATSDVDAFVFDHTETTPQSLPVKCVGNSDLTHPDHGLCSDARWDLDTLDCSDFAAPKMPRPCIWTGSGSSAEVVCAEGESPCWKPVQSFGFSGGASDGLRLSKSAPIPHVKNSGLRWNDLGGCEGSHCGGEITFFVQNDGQLKPHTDMKRDHLPQPLILIHETIAGGGVNLVNNFGTNGTRTSDLIRLSVITNGEFHVSQGAVFAGAGCRQGPATPNMLSERASCVSTTNGLSADNGRCFAVRALDACTLENNLGVLGQLRCKTINVNNTGCMIGGLAATAGSTGPVTASPCSTDAGINVHSNANIIGDLSATGSICLRNEITVQGNIETKGSVYLQHIKVDGQIVAEKNVDMTNDTRVNVIDPITFDSGRLETAAWVESTW